MIQGIRQGPNYKWWVFGAIGIGTFLSVVDHGSVLVALPNIERHFRTDLPTVQWVVVGYALAISVLLLPMGRLGDVVGRKQVYLGGFIIFVLAAAMGGFSPNLTTVIVAKIIQGIGSAMIQGNGMAALISAFPESERGKALGAHLSVVGTGGIIGPAVGGFLMSSISSLDWRIVFLLNVPLGIICIVASFLILTRDQPGQTDQRPTFDWIGAISSGGAMLFFLLVVSNGHRLGWASATIMIGSAVSLALTIFFIWWELQISSPMLELRLFKRKLFALGALAGWISFLGSSVARFMMPFYLQRVLEYSPREVGLFMMPAAVSMVVLGPLSGRLSDKFGWQPFTIAGLALSAIASLIFAIGLTEKTSVGLIILVLMLQSAGNGLFNSPNNSSILSAVERHRYGVTSALTQLIRNSANVVSIAVATTVVVLTMGSMGLQPSLDTVSPEVATGFIAGLHRAFALMTGILLVGIVVCLLRGAGSRDSFGMPSSA